jgi:hypothetical protein
MKGKRFFSIELASAMVLALLAGLALAQEPASIPLSAGFTYQGRLRIDGAPYTGFCDLEFSMWDELTGGNQVGNPQTVLNADLLEGFFTVLLDWGPQAFAGDHRFLEIHARCPAGGGPYTSLEPRQDLTPTPYALYAMRTPWTGLNDVPAGFADGVDNDTLYSAGPGLTLVDTTFSVDPATAQLRVNGVCGTGFAIREVLQDGNVTCEPVGGGGGNAWLLTGNSGTVPGTNYLGTSDEQPLLLKVNAQRALRLEPNAVSPNVIGGYVQNWATSGVSGAAVGGGGASTEPNLVTDSFGTVGGGLGNMVGDAIGTTDDAPYATVGGGRGNNARAYYATVGGGSYNYALASSTTVGGGSGNTASFQGATVAGGYGNTASGSRAAITGGDSNAAGGYASAAGGGTMNHADGDWTVIGGGYQNGATGDMATISGGGFNEAGDYAAVGGGQSNAASNLRATVGGGYDNTASGSESTVGGGQENTASGTASAVPGGVLNVAQGNYSFAAGHRAKAYQDGCFVWGDSSDADITCDNDDRWVARASGGVYFYTNANFQSGVYVAAGGSSWNSISDRATKENFSPADGQAILETLASLPVREYNLKSQEDSIRHVGLVAQDFAQFGYGESDKAINMEDADGVALAAIQALYAQNQALTAENADQQAQIDALEVRLAALEAASTGTAQVPQPDATRGRSPAGLGLLPVGLAAVGCGAWAARRRRTGGGR